MQISGLLLWYITLFVGHSFAAPFLIDPPNELEARTDPPEAKVPSKLSQTLSAVSTAAKIKLKFRPTTNEAIFWAGRRPGAKPGEILSLEHDAHRIAQAAGKSTLEDHLEKHKINIPPASHNRHSVKLWDVASKTFAQRAKGETHAYLGTMIRPQSVYTNKEKPILMKSKRITKLTEHNVHEGTSKVVKGGSPSRSRSRSGVRIPAHSPASTRGRLPSRTRSASRGQSPSRVASKSRSKSPARGRSTTPRGTSKGKAPAVRAGTPSRSRSPSPARGRTLSRTGSTSRSRSPSPSRSRPNSRSHSKSPAPRGKKQ